MKFYTRIFDPLFTTKDPETNSGLGLTLALQIVKEHNGTITVSTDKDKKLSLVVRFFKSEVQSGPSGF
jgi:signal transduction histidine kinase